MVLEKALFTKDLLTTIYIYIYIQHVFTFYNFMLADIFISKSVYLKFFVHENMLKTVKFVWKDVYNDWVNCGFSSSSWCRAISTDIPDPLPPPLPIVHCFWQVFRVTFRISTELLYLSSDWSSCFCSSMWRGPQEYIIYELVLTSPPVFCMSGSSNFDIFRDGW